VVNGVVYVAVSASVYAFDGVTGEKLWENAQLPNISSVWWWSMGCTAERTTITFTPWTLPPEPRNGVHNFGKNRRMLNEIAAEVCSAADEF
jgi:hypothetical protein